MKIAKRVLAPDAPAYKLSAPLKAQLASVERLSSPDSPDELLHMVFDTCGAPLQYVEGQSLGVITPGLRPDGKPHKLRLYSIASGPAGEGGRADRAALCLKRVVETQADGGEFRGVCSNYLCDLKPGDFVELTGPTGKAFALPEDDTKNIIMVATGTGVAPFRSFLQYMYAPGRVWRGQVRLYFGARTKKELMYMNEMNSDLLDFEKHSGFRARSALSREETNADGSRRYVQHRMFDEGEELWELMRDGRALVYQCGLKGMDHGVDETMHKLARAHGQDWTALKEEWKLAGLWNVEVYELDRGSGRPPGLSPRPARDSETRHGIDRDSQSKDHRPARDHRRPGAHPEVKRGRTRQRQRDHSDVRTDLRIRAD